MTGYMRNLMRMLPRLAAAACSVALVGTAAIEAGVSPASAATKAKRATAVASCSTASSATFAPENTLIVEANNPFRSVTHVASGALYGLSENGTPALRYVAPLHPSTFVQMAPGGQQLPNGEPTPAGDALVVAPEAAAAGAKVIVRMPDYYPNFPYQWVSWSNWLSVVDQEGRAVQASGDTNIEAMEIWNEPDWTWDTADAGSFDAGWVRTYDEIRSLDSTSPIEGPSFSRFEASWFQDFLAYAKANNAVPDILAWHELSGSGNIAFDVASVKKIEKSLGISRRPIIIEEYGTPSEVGVPGPLVGYVAKFERAGVTSADLAFWNHYGTMGDTLVGTGGLPNASWWLYKWYGDMSGKMVTTVPPSSTGLDGAASISAKHTVSVIFGGGSGAAAVEVNGLEKATGFSSCAHVALEHVISRGRTTPVTAPGTISVGDYSIVNGSITVPVNAMNPGNGYHLVITPEGKAAPSLTGAYQLENGTSGLMLGTGGSSNSGTAASLESGGGARDQLWDLESAGDGYYEVVNETNGLVLGVDSASTSSGAAVEQLTWDGDTGELWSLTKTSHGEDNLVNENSGMQLSFGASPDAGSPAVQEPAGSGTGRAWTLVRASDVSPNTPYTVTNVNSGLKLGLQAGATTAGTLVDQASADGLSDQQWEFIPAGDGEYQIKNVAGGLLLGIQDASTAWGASALIWSDNGTPDHLWQIEPNGDGSYLIANANSGMVLGVDDASTASGAQALQWPDTATPDHLWRLTPAS